MLKELKITETDNRDEETTDLILENDSYVEVNPFDLVKNVIENSCEDEVECEKLIKKLDKILEELEK